MSVLVTGIAELVTNDPALGDGPLGRIPDAALVTEHGSVVWAGPATAAPEADDRTDVGGRAVVPGFVDSHAHPVFAGDRAAEFEARMSGARYDGGGIATTVAATRAASDDTLRARLHSLLAQMRRQGTTTVEVTSGYGLTVGRPWSGAQPRVQPGGIGHLGAMLGVACPELGLTRYLVERCFPDRIPAWRPALQEAIPLNG